MSDSQDNIKQVNGFVSSLVTAYKSGKIVFAIVIIRIGGYSPIKTSMLVLNVVTTKDSLVEHTPLALCQNIVANKIKNHSRCYVPGLPAIRKNP